MQVVAHRCFLAVSLAGVLSCGSGASAPPSTPKEARTRYEVGDHIVYRYSGAFTPAPVTLRERIVEKKGQRLAIEVTAERANESKRWRQVVTDTPENVENNVVDELYEISGSGERKLQNANNEDLFRLYEWTLVTPEGEAHDVRTTRVKATFANHTYDCERTEGVNTWHDRPLRFETLDCPDFVWTHGPARFWDEATGQDICRVEIVEAGR